MSKIKELSSQQWAAINELIEESLRIALCCDPLDKEKAKSAIDALYARLKLPPPNYLLFSSPLTCMNFSISSYSQLYSLFSIPLYSLFSSPLYSLFSNQFSGQLYGQLLNHLYSQLYGRPYNQLYNHLINQFHDEFNSQLKGIFYLAGQHWVYRSSIYRATILAGAKCKQEDILQLTQWEAEARACHWWFPYKSVVLLSDRHREVHFDDRRRLHNLRKPAVVYSDGWGVYAIHGVRVPKKYIETPADEIDPAEVLNESNAQVRMAVISKIGFARMIGKLPHTVISLSPNRRGVDKQDELIEFNLGNNLLVRGLHVRWKEKSGEEKENVIPVWHLKEDFGNDCPDDINNCEQVRRWVMRLPKNAEIVEEV